MKNKKIRIAITGAGGRMGRKMVESILQKDNIVLGTVLEREDSSLLGIDVGELIGIKKTGVIIQRSLNIVQNDFDVLIDFTHPEGTLKYLDFCKKNNKPMVIGTTGFTNKDKKVIYQSSKDIAIVFTSNFSVGINVMMKLLEKTAKLIGNRTDIEIIEIHHRHKVDVPSGTALEMGKVITKSLNKDSQKCTSYLQKRNLNQKIANNIGFSTIRVGDVVGEHKVMFVDIGERIEIIHKSSSRINFVNGAIQSALWIKERKNGIFDMQDVLNLNNL